MIELQLNPFSIRNGPGSNKFQASATKLDIPTNTAGSIIFKIVVLVAAIFLTTFSFFTMALHHAIFVTSLVLFGGGLGIGLSDKIVFFCRHIYPLCAFPREEASSESEEKGWDGFQSPLPPESLPWAAKR